ncbi:MAG: hypothetical protein AAF399_27475, partial [Bacteroidota bacterium]
MKISASLFSNKTLPLEDLVRQLDQSGTDYFHLDCADDPRVLEKIATIRSAIVVFLFLPPFLSLTAKRRRPALKFL